MERVKESRWDQGEHAGGMTTSFWGALEVERR
jgi:hypothetical protein